MVLSMRQPFASFFYSMPRQRISGSVHTALKVFSREEIAKCLPLSKEVFNGVVCCYITQANGVEDFAGLHRPDTSPLSSLKFRDLDNNFIFSKFHKNC